MKMKQVISLFLLLYSLNAFCQDWKRTLNWYFGNGAGLSFHTNPPTILTNSAMYALEGSAVMSDTNGNLLFYTNGQTVWNKNHQIMDGGTGLTAFSSSTQPAIIIPQPETDSVYFILTTNPSAGLYYHKININANGGLGKIIEKNILLMSPTTEKIAATKHGNGRDVWVCTHEYQTNNFYCYLINSKGINICPIQSSVGSPLINPWSAPGELKFSGSGQLIGMVSAGDNFFELFKFDNCAGLVSEPVKIQVQSLIYSLCFSPNEKYFYLTERDAFLTQYKIGDYSQNQIKNSRFEVAQLPSVDIQGMQIGTNGKIYLTIPYKDSLDLIDSPDLDRNFCHYVKNNIGLSGKQGRHNLPQYISSYYYFPALSFSYTNDCKNNFEFTSKDTFNANSLTWTFSKNNQIRTTQYGSNVSYTFPETGNWSIKLSASNGIQSDSVIKEITVYTPYESMGKDTVVCADSLLLDAGSAHCYLWQDSSSDRYFNVKQSGEYVVKVVTRDFCTVYDTIKVVLDKHSVNNVIYRNGDTLFSSAPYKKYQWYRNNAILGNETASKHMLFQDGRYKLLVTDEGNCTGFSNEITVDTLTNIQQIQKPVVTIYPNPSNESGFTIQSDKILNHVIVYAVNGQKIKEFNQINSTTTHISGLSKGVYILSTDNLFYHKITIH